MTCIVGLEDKGTVYIGGDSAGVSGLSIAIRSDEKVFSNGPFLMGFTTSFRMGQLLRYKLSVPKQNSDQSDYQFMVTDFIDAIRKCFADNGFGTMTDKSSNKGGTFLVGYNGSLYVIYDDFQVGADACGYNSVGCGSDIAVGSFHSTVGKKPEVRVKMALEAAAFHSAGVAAPFSIFHQPKVKK